MFGESIAFAIDGKSTYNSVLGTVVSLAILVITMSYGFELLISMLEYQNTTHLNRIDAGENQTGGLSQAATNYNIAVGLYSATSWRPERVDYEGYLDIEFA